MTRLQIYKQTSELYQKCSMVGRDRYAAEKIYELTHKYVYGFDHCKNVL